MTKTQLERRVHFLTVYAGGSSLLLLILFFGGFDGEDEVIRHDKVVAERVEVVESDGDPVLIAANADQFPRAEERVSEGKPGRRAGMVFYDGDGQEIGALASRVAETDSGRYVLMQMKFDRFGHNAVFGVGHEETPSHRSTGLLLNQQVGTPTNRETRRRATLGTSAGSVLFELRDDEARPRIRMEVDSSGMPKMIFLDEEGNISHHYPPQK